MQAVLDRVAAGLIEVLDVEVVGRAADGSARLLPFAEVSGMDQLTGAESDILDEVDLTDIASALEPGRFAVAFVYEDRTLASAADAWSAVGGSEVVAGGVDLAELERLLGEEEEGTN